MQSELRVMTQSRMIPLKNQSALPGSAARRGHCLRCGGGSPSHIPSTVSRRHTDGSGGPAS